MAKMNLAAEKKMWGDTAVDRLVAGLRGNVMIGLFLVLAVSRIYEVV